MPALVVNLVPLVERLTKGFELARNINRVAVAAVVSSIANVCRVVS